MKNSPRRTSSPNYNSNLMEEKSFTPPSSPSRRPINKITFPTTSRPSPLRRTSSPSPLRRKSPQLETIDESEEKITFTEYPMPSSSPFRRNSSPNLSRDIMDDKLEYEFIEHPGSFPSWIEPKNKYMTISSVIRPRLDIKDNISVVGQELLQDIKNYPVQDSGSTFPEALPILYGALLIFGSYALNYLLYNDNKDKLNHELLKSRNSWWRANWWTLVTNTLINKGIDDVNTKWISKFFGMGFDEIEISGNYNKPFLISVMELVNEKKCLMTIDYKRDDGTRHTFIVKRYNANNPNTNNDDEIRIYDTQGFGLTPTQRTYLSYAHSYVWGTGYDSEASYTTVFDQDRCYKINLYTNDTYITNALLSTLETLNLNPVQIESKTLNAYYH